VTVISRVAEDRVMEEYRRHDALLWTSTYEGFGLVLLEAMSQRLPVISTPAGCAATLVRAGETGFPIPFRNADALAAAIVRLTAQPAEARRLADNACAAVASMTWRSTAEQTLAVYRSAIDRAHK
jgi:glycosyltransferase involved in cell wall biosynthesis